MKNKITFILLLAFCCCINFRPVNADNLTYVQPETTDELQIHYSWFVRQAKLINDLEFSVRTKNGKWGLLVDPVEIDYHDKLVTEWYKNLDAFNWRTRLNELPTNAKSVLTYRYEMWKGFINSPWYFPEYPPTKPVPNPKD